MSRIAFAACSFEIMKLLVRKSRQMKLLESGVKRISPLSTADLMSPLYFCKGKDKIGLFWQADKNAGVSSPIQFFTTKIANMSICNRSKVIFIAFFFTTLNRNKWQAPVTCFMGTLSPGPYKTKQHQIQLDDTAKYTRYLHIYFAITTLPSQQICN